MLVICRTKINDKTANITLMEITVVISNRNFM